MQYLGGKSRTRNQIAAYLNDIRKPGQPYWEPFVGAGWVLEKIKGEPIFASDANQALIFMWQSLQRGWEPPSAVDEDLYKQAKNGLCTAELTAFIGFACSFSGKWFSGYARGCVNYARVSKNRSLAKINNMGDIHFFQADFLTCYIPAHQCLIYCDPPYQNTTGYGAVPDFDIGVFWNRVRWLEEHGHTVVVSEYQAPNDFCCVLEIPIKTVMHTKNGKDLRTERLFRLGDHKPMKPRLFELEPVDAT